MCDPPFPFLCGRDSTLFSPLADSFSFFTALVLLPCSFSKRVTPFKSFHLSSFPTLPASTLFVRNDWCSF